MTEETLDLSFVAGINLGIVTEHIIIKSFIALYGL
jgi:hypothetical protein